MKAIDTTGRPRTGRLAPLAGALVALALLTAAPLGCGDDGEGGTSDATSTLDTAQTPSDAAGDSGGPPPDAHGDGAGQDATPADTSAPEIPQDAASEGDGVADTVPPIGDVADATAPDATPPDADATDTSVPLPEVAFASPYDVVVAGGWVVVCNANLDPSFVPGPGWLTVIDATTLAVVHRIPLPAPNPQFLWADDEAVYVSMSGPSTFDVDAGLVVATGSSALGRVAIDALDVATGLDAVAHLDHVGAPTAGFIGSFVVDGPTGQAFVGSGTGPFVYQVDLTTWTFVRDELDPIVVGTDDGTNHLVTLGLATGGAIAAADFNTGLVHLLDAATATWAPETLQTGTPTEPGGEPAAFPGPMLPRTWNDTLHVLDSMTGVVAALAPEGATTAGTVPLYPNRWQIDGDVALVSVTPPMGDSEAAAGVFAVDLGAGGEATLLVTLDADANPMGLAVDPDAARLLVVANGTDSLVVADRATGEVLQVVAP